jgi:hypothetical protein
MKDILMHSLKKTPLLIVAISMVSCGFFSEDEKAQKTTEATKVPYIVQPNYEHPEFKTLDATFSKQEHRFEINRCEFKYNEQPFFIGDAMEKIISVFGEPDGGKIKSGDGSVIFFDYEKLKFHAKFSNTDKKLKSYKMYLSDYSGHKDTPYKIIKLRKIPYQLDMKLNEFMELSDLKHDKNLKHGSAAFYILNEKKCYETSNLELEIGSRPSYKSTVIGGGHLTTTIDGDFNPELTSQIERILISIKE